MEKQNRAMELYRFVCSVMILCYHCYFFAFRDVEGSEIFVGFYLFVELFFILSGFLMLHSVRTRLTEKQRLNAADTTAKYMKRRLQALYPHHLLSFALVAAIELFLTRQLKVLDLFRVGWAEVLLVNAFGFVRDAYINIVCWYLSVLVFSSILLYYLLVRHEDVFLKVLAPFLLVFLYGTIFDRKGCLANTILFTQHAPFLGFYRGFADMTVGCLAYRVYEWMKDVELPGEWLIATILELAVMIASAFWMYGHWGKVDFLFVPLFFAFVISVFRGKSLFTRLFDNGLSGWLGHLSYAYFLNNLVVLYPFMHFFPDAGIWMMALVCIPVCLVVSVFTTALTDGLAGRRRVG